MCYCVAEDTLLITYYNKKNILPDYLDSKKEIRYKVGRYQMELLQYGSLYKKKIKYLHQEIVFPF